jgi:hypothetical protein
VSPDPSVAEAEEGGGSRRGRHVPVRAENSLAHVDHALARRWRWSEWRLSVEAGDAGEPVGEGHVL